jgi:hypothetical protein
MSVRNLDKFVSHKDSKDFLGYLTNNTLTETVGLSPEGDSQDIAIKLEKVMIAAREYHASRLSGKSLKVAKYLYTEKSLSFDHYLEADWVGVLYLDNQRLGDLEVFPYEEVLDSDLVENKYFPKLIAFWEIN